ncbi:hypothetical protein P355_1545 [Burkholderia cenocepacia KC-01]|nr:hypothetical protein P355_1545 [Burkholderia cenocepacia KC-01]
MKNGNRSFPGGADAPLRHGMRNIRKRRFRTAETPLNRLASN